MFFKLRRSKADALFSDLIRTLADWTCERCHTPYEPPTSLLHCSHFHSRAKKSVRFDKENAAALCIRCHQYLGGNPQEHLDFFRKRLGQKRLDLLEVRARTITKVDEKAIAMALKIELDELKRVRRQAKVVR